MVRSGTSTTPPPRPVSDPSSPAANDTAATTRVKIGMVIGWVVGFSVRLAAGLGAGLGRVTFPPASASLSSLGQPEIRPHIVIPSGQAGDPSLLRGGRVTLPRAVRPPRPACI